MRYNPVVMIRRNIFIILITILAFTLPITAKAFDFGRLIDPACFFACEDDNDRGNITNSYNTNSNINSNNVTVNSSTGSTQVHTSRNEVSKPSNTQVVVNRPNYDDYYNYNGQLTVSCYSSPSSGNIGDTIRWYANASGGRGNYSYSWSGTEGLSSSGQSISKSYRDSGTKSATVTVTSGNQTISQSCSNTAYIYEDRKRDNYYDDYYRNRNNDYYRNNNDYYYNNNYYYNYSPLYVSCYADRTVASTETPINWTANVSGGNGNYSYAWYGTDMLRGYNRVNSILYNSVGNKTAYVTVTSGSQTVTQHCSNSVNINQNYTPNYNNYPYDPNIYNYPNTNGIQVACYADRTSATIGSPVVWSVEAVGGNGIFNYIWSGSDNLVGNQISTTKAYDTLGVKTAMVTAVASNGQSVSQVCGNTVSVKSNTVAKAKTGTTLNKDTNEDNTGIIASIISLKNVPWIGVLVVLVFIMLITIIYLIFNKTKI